MFSVLGSTAADGGTMTNILKVATEVLTWFITSMGAMLKFVIDNPVILVLFMIFMTGSVIGMLMRIWKSV